MTGIELIKEANMEIPELKSIILTGYSQFNYAVECIKIGVEDYLLKPVNSEELENTLEKIINKIDKWQKNAKFLALENNDDSIPYRPGLAMVFHHCLTILSTTFLGTTLLLFV